MPFLATVIADEKVTATYHNIEFQCTITISKEKSLTRDLSPVSAKMLRSLVDAIMWKRPFFSKIRDVTGTMFLSLTSRLRGAEIVSVVRPKSKRWKRSYLCMLSPSGVFPLPLKLWLAFPDLGVLTPGVARAFILA